MNTIRWIVVWCIVVSLSLLVGVGVGLYAQLIWGAFDYGWSL